MKINWSTMNRLGFNTPADEFASFTPAGGSDVGATADNGHSADEDDEFVETGTDLGDEEDDEDNDPDGQVPDPTQPKPRQQPGYRLSAEQLAQISAQSAMQAMQQRQAPGAPQMTEAEMHKLLKRPEVAAEVIARLRNPEVTPEEALKDLQSLLDGNFTYSLNATQALLQQQLAPLLEMQRQFATQQQQAKLEGFKKSLLNDFGALRKYGNVVDQAMNSLRAKGFNSQGMSDKQVKQTVAREARDLIRQVMPDFSLKQSNSTQRQAGSFSSRTPGRSQGHPQQGQAGFGSFKDIL